MALRFPSITENVTKATKAFFTEIFAATEEGVEEAKTAAAAASTTASTAKTEAGEGKTKATEAKTEAAAAKTAAEGSYKVSTTEKTAAYEAKQADGGTCLDVNKSSTTIMTLPELEVGTVIEFCQIGAGQVELVKGTGVTLHNPSSVTTRAQYSTISVRYRTVKEVIVSGDLT